MKSRGAGASLAVLALCWLGVGGCASAPEVRYYRVALTPPPTASAPLPVRLGIGRLASAEPTRQERILYRDSPYRIQYYASDRWEDPPAVIVQAALVEHLRASGRFQRVVPWGREATDARLGVRLQTFEEVDEGDAWFGEVVLAYEIVAPDGRSLGQGTSRQRIRAEGHSVDSVVAALSRALSACLEDVTERTAAALAGR